MTTPNDFEIFLVATPGLEPELLAETQSLNFRNAKIIPGGIEFSGKWPEVWRASLQIRGASRILARIGSFRAMHLAQLDKRARKFPWADILRKDVPVRVEFTCKKSRIYHAGAAAERVETAIREEFGAPIEHDADLCIKARIEDDLCTFSIDTSGEGLHKRGFKEAIAKAPMRETLASLFLRRCGYQGLEPVLDPMCGSGTFVIEAAEIAAGLMPGRGRHFAFEQLANFDEAKWRTMSAATPSSTPPFMFHGSDRDAGAIKASLANAERAGVSAFTDFQRKTISELAAPEGPPGLVIVNPPFGTRIGDKKPLHALYGALGNTLKTKFAGWRVGLVTTEPALAKSTGLPFHDPGRSISHGGLKVLLFQTSKLP